MLKRFVYYRNRIISQIKDGCGQVTFVTAKPVFIHQEVAYFSQWESPELVKSILNDVIRAEDDPKWRRSGASTPEEYADWSWSGCGLACLKMILAHALKQVIPLVTLGRQALEYGVYRLPLKAHPGLYYLPFKEFITKKYGLRARVISGMSMGDIIHALNSQGYVIASVSPEIRSPGSKPVLHAGHLILIIGYDLRRKYIYFHNPSQPTSANQNHSQISFKDFQKFFAYRGVVVTT